MQNFVDKGGNEDVIYKDVVIVGNGPSGICLSYMLAGNWPYYTGEPHPGDEMLTARLHFSTRIANEEPSTISGKDDQDQRENAGAGSTMVTEGKVYERGLARSTRWKLECLSSGLEGRTGGKPLSLLMDQLQHPCVDAGLDVPSLLTWKSVEQRPEHKVIDNVVLGKGQPGGSWQSMDPNVLTISLNRWMSLPDLDIRQWEMLIEQNGEAATTHYPYQEKPNGCKAASRVSVGTVAAYYRDYVRIKRLEQYFRCGTMVTSVRPAETEHYGFNWIVDGHVIRTGKPFRYRCKRVILATGTTDLSNQLGIPDENSHTDWVTHDLNELESRLDRLVDSHIESHVGNEQEDERSSIAPVLVIGAGLSAADAIMAARFRGIPVLHAFHDPSTNNDWSKSNADKIRSPFRSFDRLQGLPSSMYPEYHKVYEMMADGGANYPLYQALPGYTLLGFDTNDRIDSSMNHEHEPVVVLSAPNGCVHRFRVSIVAILIGYKPDLSYLEGNGIGLGKISDKPIDGKSNPIEVDDFTYEVIKAPRSGLYALGPLVGDNFVRYILGGAFGILAHILNSSPTT